jgi:hypothetical protein
MTILIFDGVSNFKQNSIFFDVKSFNFALNSLAKEKIQIENCIKRKIEM